MTPHHDDIDRPIAQKVPWFAGTVQAMWQRPRRGRVRALTVHTTEEPELRGKARLVALYFGGKLPPEPPAPGASCHVVVDADEIWRCVDDEAAAFGAPGRLADGTKIVDAAMHCEFVGRANQTAEQWADDYSTRMLERGAPVFASWCRRFGLPMDRPDLVELKRRDEAGEGIGIVGHHDWTLYTGRGTHTDPGPFFPWERFLALIKAA